ncbi:MAG TPA: nuclear transport factor 2 family protein [Acidimicrobiales bacterium]|nr:nuclear transport factor 2 family protein [Acidimicrobiales bacterium]
MSHPNEDLVRRGYEAFSSGDMDTLAQVMSADVVHRVPGKHQLSGEYKGQASVFGYYGKLNELTDGNFRVELQSVQAKGDNEVITQHRNIGQRAGKNLDEIETLAFKVANGKITELEEKPQDQAATDDFWGAA